MAVRFGRATMLQIANVYGLRMAGVFMVSLSTIWQRTGLMPRSVVVLTYLLALTLLVVTTLSLWATLVFPVWVLVVSVIFLLRSHTVDGSVVPDARRAADERG